MIKFLTSFEALRLEWGAQESKVVLGAQGQKQGLVTWIYDLICSVILFSVNIDLKKCPTPWLDFVDKNKYKI